jgi:hypothetical protein
MEPYNVLQGFPNRIEKVRLLIGNDGKGIVRTSTFLKRMRRTGDNQN